MIRAVTIAICILGMLLSACAPKATDDIDDNRVARGSAPLTEVPPTSEPKWDQNWDRCNALNTMLAARAAFDQDWPKDTTTFRWGGPAGTRGIREVTDIPGKGQRVRREFSSVNKGGKREYFVGETVVNGKCETIEVEIKGR